jgi:hypothetical protein
MLLVKKTEETKNSHPMPERCRNLMPVSMYEISPPPHPQKTASKRLKRQKNFHRMPERCRNLIPVSMYETSPPPHPQKQHQLLYRGVVLDPVLHGYRVPPELILVPVLSEKKTRR